MKYLFTLSVLFTLVYCHVIDIVVAQKPLVEAIYQFGDSISDTGNNINLNSNDGCGKKPYGKTFYGSRTTGRCSNGLLIVDYIAVAAKLPYLSPFWDKYGNFSHGANFAVAGAVSGRPTLVTKVTPETTLSNQLAWFKSLLPKICHGIQDCKNKLGNSLFIVGEIGDNDYNGPAFGGNKKPSDLQSITPMVIETITGVITELINLGATKILVPGNFPVGCMTIYLAAYKTNDRTMYDELGCLKNWNELAAYHNANLRRAIKTLRAKHPNVKIAYADYFNGLRTILRDGAALGFDKANIFKACCGTGNNEFNFDGRRICGAPGVTSCPDPDRFVSWDGIHLTQHVYKIMADQITKQVLPRLLR